MPTDYLVLDVSTAPLSNVRDYLDPAEARKAPGTYKKAESIAEWQREDFEHDVDRAGLDLDLCQITGVGYSLNGTDPVVMLARPDGGMAEALMLETVRRLIKPHVTLVGYNALAFDWLVLMRRAKWLGVRFPPINCDRYRSPHVDVLQKLSLGDPSRRRSLGFYVRRHGWTDLSKPLSGADESKVIQTGQWDELGASLVHDVTATLRLAEWLKVLPTSSYDEAVA